MASAQRCATCPSPPADLPGGRVVEQVLVCGTLEVLLFDLPESPSVCHAADAVDRKAAVARCQGPHHGARCTLRGSAEGRGSSAGLREGSDRVVGLGRHRGSRGDIDVRAGAGEHLGCRALVLRHEAEQQMPCADGTVSELTGGAQRQLEASLHLRCEGEGCVGRFAGAAAG